MDLSSLLELECIFLLVRHVLSAILFSMWNYNLWNCFSLAIPFLWSCTTDWIWNFFWVFLWSTAACVLLMYRLFSGCLEWNTCIRWLYMISLLYRYYWLTFGWVFKYFTAIACTTSHSSNTGMPPFYSRTTNPIDWLYIVTTLIGSTCFTANICTLCNSLNWSALCWWASTTKCTYSGWKVNLWSTVMYVRTKSCFLCSCLNRARFIVWLDTCIHIYYSFLKAPCQVLTCFLVTTCVFPRILYWIILVLWRRTTNLF